jgi:hypothetical protein
VYQPLNLGHDREEASPDSFFIVSAIEEGRKTLDLPSIRYTLFAFAAAINLAVSFALIVKGFSHTTGLPASIASKVFWRWRV